MANDDEKQERELSDDLKGCLKTIVDHFDKEDRMVRERQLRVWKKLKFYWAGFSRLWWSEVAHDWRTYDIQQSTNLNDAAFYDKPINVFRAYLDTIIAALSVSVPSIKCYPDNSDDPMDILTAKGGDKIAELIYKHNDVPLLWIHALYIFCTEGMVCAYSYPKEDEKYGTYNKPVYGQEEDVKDIQVCPTCKTPLDDDSIQLIDDEMDEFQPSVDDHPMWFCKTCQAQVSPETQQEKFTVTRLTGVTQDPKTRQCIEVYGGLNIKIPNYARCQAECPYLIYTYETHYVEAVAQYPALKSIYKEGGGTGGVYDPYERWARLSTQYFGEYPINVGTWRKCWLRPSSYWVLQDETKINALKRRFPNGVKVVYWNDQYCESEAESLDDCWTIMYNPVQDYVHYEPMGLFLASIQDITNDLISLILQTIEHGVPQTFADPQTLNFQQYRESEVAPGQLFPAKAQTGKALGDSFYEVRTASLSAEVQPFAEKIQELGQFVVGALPSLFGGAPEAGNKTAAVYSMSRAQALQRLQTPWKALTFWWKNVFAKVIPAFIKTMQDDEHYTRRDTLGNFITVMIKRAEMQGKLGSIELEASEQVPLTWTQKKDVVMQLMQSQNPMIMEALTIPENVPLLADAIGLTDFELPEESDRTKQYEEIAQLVNSEPIQGPTGQEMPSIDVDMMVDNHMVEASICRRWLVSEAGRQAKIDKPKGYRNILLHMQHHMMAIQNQQMGQQNNDAKAEAMKQGAKAQMKPGQVPPAKPQQDSPTEGDGNATPAVH